ncbi:MAG: DUF721 domain-containing protein [Candidatus Cloacimonetes bacterium]|nr:DUF721 domain-containing protein [Candidatus Cloacimonadota bacterium]
MGFIPAGPGFKGLLLKIAGPEYQQLLQLALGWKSLVGELLSERTSLRKLEYQILFIDVSNNIWMQELILRKYQIIKDIKVRLNIELKDIIFCLKGF